MREKNKKIIHLGNNPVFLYYDPAAASVVISDNGKTETVSESVKPEFSLFRSGNNRLYLLVQKEDGCICIKSLSVSETSEKVLFNSRSSPYIFASGNEDSLDLIYNIPAGNGRTQHLMHSAFINGTWELPKAAAEFFPFEKTPFIPVRNKDGSASVYYKTSDVMLCSRELGFMPYDSGKQTVVLHTSQAISDISVVSDENRRHVLCSVKGPRNGQIIYKNSDSVRPKVIFEDKHTDGVAAFKFRTRLYLLFISGSGMFFAFSEDNGNSFSPVQKYKNFFGRIEKYEYINRNPDLLCDEVFFETDLREILFLPDLYRDFFKKEEPAESKPDEICSNDDTENYKRIIQTYEANLAAANGHITSLTKNLAEKNNELSALNAEYRVRFKMQNEEIERLKRLASASTKTDENDS